MRRFGRLTAVAALVAFIVACQAIDVRKVSSESRAIEARGTVLDGDDVSLLAREVLHGRGLANYRADPVGAIRVLDAEMRETHDRDLAATIAELGYIQKRLWTNVDFQALAAAIRYSYAYLFDPRLEPEAAVYDARFRGMCDLYNAATGDWIRATRELPVEQRLDLQLDWYGGSGAVRVTENALTWDHAEFDTLEIASDFAVEGLEPPGMRRGIGVACLLSRAWNREKALARDTKRKFRYLPSTVSFPLTLLVRWPDDCSILDAVQPEATVEVLDPIESVSVPIRGRAVPIEVDYTTPIAVMVASTSPPSGIDALLHTQEYADRSGLIMFQPFRKDRIPVLFVHGLASGPETWFPLYNRLLADETIRTRFQFMFWFYPTGGPALQSAATLRKALNEAHEALGPDSGFRDRKVGVVCAHSLGGILTNTLVTDSGDKLWNIAFKVPPEQLPADPELLQALKEGFFFTHLPFVQRVIYYSSPHRGAPAANKGIAQWASGLISLPKDLLSKEAKLNK
ncbi:MAG: esterase/lipase family protein, partial [Planctomycetota bacterium]